MKTLKGLWSSRDFADYRLNPEKGWKLFWKSCKLYLSKKHSLRESKIALGTIQKWCLRGRGRGYPKLMIKIDIEGSGYMQIVTSPLK